MKKLNAYLMGMMSVAMCLFLAACSSDDDDTTNDKSGKEISVEAIFANDGLTRAAIGGDGSAARPMSFELGDVLRLVKTDNTTVTVDFRSYHADTNPAHSNKKIYFRGILPEGVLANYTAYLISSGSTWKEEGSVPSMGKNAVGTPSSTLDAAFKKDAVISGTFDDTGYDDDSEPDRFVLSLKNAFVVNTTGANVTFWYTESGEDKSVTLVAGETEAVAVGDKTELRNEKTSATKTNTVAANHIYKF